MCVADPEHPSPPPPSVRRSTPDLNHSYRALFPSLLWPVILLLPGSEFLFGLTQGPPLCVCVHLLAKMDSKARASGKKSILWSGAPSLLWSTEEPFCTCVVREASLTLRMRNMWSLYLLSKFKQDSAPPCSCHYLYLEVSVHRGQISAVQPGVCLSGMSVVVITQEI